MGNIKLRDLEFILGGNQLVKLIDNHFNMIYFGPWYKCHYMGYDVIDLINDKDYIRIMVRKGDYNA